MSGVEEILEFWIGPAADDAIESSNRSRLWYASSIEADDLIADKFRLLLSQAEAGELDDWTENARGSLALVVLLDQFTRNIYRGKPDAFRNDNKALKAASHATDLGQDLTLSLLERAFMYHPFEHSEILVDPERSVELFGHLELTAPEAWQKQMRSFADYARIHNDVIKTFGRFPHRNAVLGRDNSSAEKRYLEKGGRRFGQ